MKVHLVVVIQYNIFTLIVSVSFGSICRYSMMSSVGSTIVVTIPELSSVV